MANEQKLRNLNLADMKKKVKKLDEKVLHKIDVDGEVYTVEIDKAFRKTKQYKLVDDLIAFLNEGNRQLELLEMITPYVSLLIIKHFTSVEVSDDIDEALELLNAFIDLDLLGVVIGLMPEEEVAKVYDLIAVATERMNETIEEALKEAEALKEQVDNEEVKEMLENGNK